MKYLKKFNDHSEYIPFTLSNKFIKPNVSYCMEEDEAHYNPINWSKEYFTIESLEDNNTIYLKASNAAITKTISVSTDNGFTWTEYTSSTNDNGTTLAILNAGDKLLVKGENSTYATSNSYYNQFKSTRQFKVNGNIMSLVSGNSFDNTDELTGTYMFCYLFYQCEGLVSAENLVLPATTLTDYCYGSMFAYCTSLTTAPSVLPATTLVLACYQSMFRNCTSLTTPPVLPATTLASSCYSTMFYNCTSLTTAPQLPTTTLVYRCYYYMFNSCISLNSITCLATNISSSYTTDWTKGVAASGIFIKDANTTWSSGTSGIPSGWTIQNNT